MAKRKYDLARSSLFELRRQISDFLEDIHQRVTAGGWTSSGGKLFPKSLGDKVGIGTNSPTEALDVVGNAVVSGRAGIGPGAGSQTAPLSVRVGNRYVNVSEGTSSNHARISGQSGAGGDSYMEVSGYAVSIVTAGTVRMTIKNNGTINFSNVQTGSSGLSTGDVYKDSSGFLKIV